MESGFVHKCNDDTLDPQYMGFLDGLREDKSSYALEIAVSDGLTVRMKYEYEKEQPKGSVTRAPQNLSQNGVLKANSGTDQNKENVRRGLPTRNCVIEKAVENRQNSQGVSQEKRDKNLNPWKNSSKGEPANIDKRVFQKKEKLGNALILWNITTDKRVEKPQNSDYISRGREVVSRRLLRREPAIKKGQAHPSKETLEFGLIARNDVIKKQIEVHQNSNDISMGRRHRNAKPLETSFQREPTNRKRKSWLMRKDQEMKSSNPLCGGSKGVSSKMDGQFVPRSSKNDLRLSKIRESDVSDESFVELVSWAYDTTAYITNDKRAKRHANNNGDSSRQVEIFGIDDLPCCVEKSPLLICYRHDEMDMDSKESPRIPGRTSFTPRNAKPLDTFSQREPIKGKRKNLLTRKNPEMKSAKAICSSKGGPSKMDSQFSPQSTTYDSRLSNISKSDDSDKSYVAMVSRACNNKAYITNDNRIEKCANSDGDSSSEVEILEIEDLLHYGEKNPFVVNNISCSYDEVDIAGQEPPQSPQGTHFSPFREKLIALLEKPFNSNEYSRLLTKATYRKPKRVFRIHPDGKTRAYDTVSKSFLNQYSDLAEKVDAVRFDRQRVLNLLRGFFYYLENMSVEGSFLPWLDSSCLMVLPEAK